MEFRVASPAHRVMVLLIKAECEIYNHYEANIKAITDTMCVVFENTLANTSQLTGSLLMVTAVCLG